MQIFDSFPNRQQAEAFANRIQTTRGLQTQVFDLQEESNEVDIFPFELNPPIVMVERTFNHLESEIVALAAEFDGSYAGT